MDDLVPYLIERGAAWIRNQRAIHRGAASPLPPEAVRLLAPFFQPATLESVRYRVVPSIENPPFHADLERAGIAGLLDFSRAIGITFDDTVVISAAGAQAAAASLGSLRFHESVHVAQYRHLGVERFTAEYVLGWARNGFDYYRIPLEQHAYALQAGFDLAPADGFSVEESVRSTFP